MSSSPDRETDTVARRLQKYERFQKLDLYLGGGLGGLVLFGDLAKDAFTAASDWVRAGFITFAMITGLSIGSAYSGFQWAQTELERKRDDAKRTNSSSTADRPIADVAPNSWPSRAFLLQKSAPVLLGLTAIWLLVAAWWRYRHVTHWIASVFTWLGEQLTVVLVALLILNVALMS